MTIASHNEGQAVTVTRACESIQRFR